MAPTASVSRRKSNGGKGGLVITLTVDADKLKRTLDPDYVKEDSPAKMDVEETNGNKETQEAQDSPATSATLPAPAVTNGETASDSNPGTPAGDGTPAPTSMGPPTEGVKKKGTKRGAGAANGLGPDGQPKVRGKPGPKKKARLYVYPFCPLPTYIDSLLMISFVVRMEQSTRMPVAVLADISWVPRPTKVPSTPAYELSIEAASPAASGRGAASSSRASQVSSGRFLDGPRHPSSCPSPPPRTLPPPQPTAAPRRTRRMTKSRATLIVPSTAAPTSRCGAHPAAFRLALRPQWLSLPRSSCVPARDISFWSGGVGTSRKALDTCSEQLRSYKD